MGATLKFLNYESMIKMEIKDEYFNEIQIPSLSLGFERTDFITKKKLFETFNNKFERNSNLSIFQKLYDEFKILKIFECKIKFKGILEDCDKYVDPLFNIYVQFGNHADNIQRYYDFMKSYDRINESLINGLKVNGFGFSIVYMTTNKKENQLEMKRKYFPTFVNLRQQEFVRITTNSNEYHFQLYLHIDKDFEVDYGYGLPNLKYFFKVEFMEQKNFMVIKKSFRFLEFPYESKCSYYNSDKTLFNSSSHKHCVRQCIRFNCEIKKNCSCFIIKHTVNQMDYGFQNRNPCQYNQSEIITFFETFCKNLCPNDCIQDEYILIERDNTLSIDANLKLTLNWDCSKPFITNIETPVMTFEDYIYYIGGLFGMWFGINANQLFIKLIENFSNYFRAIINFFIVLFYTLIEIAIFIKAKLQSNIYSVYSFFKNII
jgi:hypothetical protein